MSKRRTFFDEIQWFASLFMVFGLWPAWQNSKYKVPLAIYSIFTISIPCYIFVSAVFINDVFKDSELTSPVGYSMILSVLATHLIICVQAFCYRNTLLKLTNKFSSVDRLCNTKLQLFISYRKENHALIIRFMIFALALIGVKCVLIFHLQYRGRLGAFWYHCFYSVLINRLRCGQVLFFVFLLRARLALINEKLKEIIIGRSARDSTPNDWRPIVDMKNVIFVLDNAMSKQSVYDRLLHLKQIYGELYEICELINITFGWSLLAMITQCFIDFTSNSYWTFLELEQAQPDIQNAM